MRERNRNRECIDGRKGVSWVKEKGRVCVCEGEEGEGSRGTVWGLCGVGVGAW